MASFSAGTTFTDGVANDVTAAKLAALVNAATPTSGLIQDRTAETAIAADDTLLFGDFSDSNNLKRMTVANFNNVVTTGTGTAASPAIVPTGDSNTGIFFPAADTIAFSEGGAEAMRIDSSGNVGIKNSTPSSYNAAATDLVIGSGSSNSGITISGSTNGLGSIHFADGTSGDTAYRGIIKYEHTTDNLQLFTAATERLRIDSSGNLLVGTTSNFSADKMCLNFTSAQNGLGVRDDSDSSGAIYAVFRNSTNGITGTIARVTTTNAVAYNTTSDQRLKSNIADALPVLDKLMDVKVRQFDWTEGNLHQDAGFIAQELAPVLPGIVTEGRTQDDWWQLDYARLTPYLVKAIQEQQTIITSLTARITALEAA